MASVDATSHIQRINTPLTCQTLAHMHDRRQASAFGEQSGVCVALISADRPTASSQLLHENRCSLTERLAMQGHHPEAQ